MDLVNDIDMSGTANSSIEVLEEFINLFEVLVILDLAMQPKQASHQTRLLCVHLTVCRLRTT